MQNSLYLDAKLDQVRIFSSALSSSQVTELYNENLKQIHLTLKLYCMRVQVQHNLFSNVGMDLETNGGLVWIKNRDSAYNHYLYDSIRGAKNILASDSTIANTVQTNGLSSFEANGFFLEGNRLNVNENNSDIVAWVWLGGGEAQTLTNTGNVNSDVSVNNEAGFSIVKASYGSGDYTKTVKHGLTTPPEIIIVKRTDSSGTWYVFEDTTGSLLGSDNHLHLDTGDASDSDTTFSIQSSDTFKTGYSTGAYDIIAYCFHSVSGYSKIGTYAGGNTGSGNAISCGFQPSWLMVKCINSTGGP